MCGQSQAVDIVYNYVNGLFDKVFCNEISGPGVLVAWADFGRSDELFGLAAILFTLQSEWRH